MKHEKINIAVVDDHQLFREGMVKLINSLDESFEVILQASNGQDFLNRLANEHSINVVIIDLDMPIMDGYELAAVLKNEHPELHVLTLTMHGENETSIIRMIRNGVKGYLSKDVDPEDLKAAINTISEGRFHFNAALSGKMLEIIINEDGGTSSEELNDRHKEFIELCCSELTYKEIADRMFASPKTVDGYRATLFERFEVKSRVGLVLLAIEKGWYKI